MNDPLDLDRFRALADAYGGVVAKWPKHYHLEASRIGTTPTGAAVLARASTLDDQLDAWCVPAPSLALTARIVAGQPTRTVSLGSQLRWWWSGLGLAATLAGAMAGTAAVAMVAPIEAGAGSSTSFGDVAETDG